MTDPKWDRYKSWEGQERSCQMPPYADKEALHSAREELEGLPPLVIASEIRDLKSKLADVAEGRAFLLQGGDCAEPFKSPKGISKADSIKSTFNVLLQMALVLTYTGKLPVVKVGRMAGQYAKPRSQPTETRGEETLPSYYGDIINGIEFSKEAREPDPKRLIQGYHNSAETLNLLRGFAQGGYADLWEAHRWLMGFAKNSKTGSRYDEIVGRITDALDFLEACGVSSDNTPQLSKVDFFISHEALCLDYEAPLIRVDSMKGGNYNTSAHMVWLGTRTKEISKQHVEFCRGIENPIGLKCGGEDGGDITPDKLLELIPVLNPQNIAGRLTLISRFGARKIRKSLPPLIEAIQNKGHKIVWSCDPMHGNTQKASNGYKTRLFTDIIDEIEQFMDIHHSYGTHPGGIHLEMTGQNVTECLGGASVISEADLSKRYHTHCDPRLNAEQALELSFLLAEKMRKTLNLKKISQQA